MDLYELFGRTVGIDYLQLKEHAASYAVSREGSTLFLFFEKSNGAEDWRNNFDFPARPYREMCDLWFCHRGFLRVFEAVKPHLSPLVEDRTVRRIILSGYSHGAALALLAHEYCVFHRPDLAPAIEGYGFGCPRVVWGRLNGRVAARFRNFTVVRNGRDLVTRLPPALLGYRHVGRMLEIGGGRGGLIRSHLAESYSDSLKEEKK